MTKKPYHVAVISPVPMFPISGGNRARIYTFITSLQASGHRVSFVLMSSRQLRPYDEHAHTRFFGADFHYLERRFFPECLYLTRRFLRVQGRRIRAMLGRPCKRADHIDEFFFPSFEQDLGKVYANDQPDIAVVQYAYFSRAFRAFPKETYRVLDTHDAFDGEITAIEERRGLARADMVIAIQEEEARKFRALLGTGCERVRTIGHIISQGPSLNLDQTNGATFLGSSFRANVASLRYFIDKVLPLVLEQEPQFILTVAGSISNDVKDHPAVKKIGFVTSPASAFLAGPILINSIVEGTGLKIKLLDAMALGVPAVSTELGVAGIPAEFLNGVCVVEDRAPKRFAEEVVRLFRDTAWRHAKGSAAYIDAKAWNTKQRSALDDVIDLSKRRSSRG